MDGHFERVTAANGVVYYCCRALPARHGFSTRLGGVSTGAYAALNLGLSSGDAEANVMANRDRWREALGLAVAPHTVHQVHGAEVQVLTSACREPAATRQADALVTSQADRPIGVFTADCGPVLMAAPAGAAVAAVHAGWRGTLAGVAAEAVEALVREGRCDAGQLVAALGPMIRGCCFEVGEEVVEAFTSAPWFTPAFVQRREGARPHLDLPGLLRRQLAHAGLREDHIHDAGLCTMCQAEEFHSWRRDGAMSGRMQAVIVPTGGAA